MTDLFFEQELLLKEVCIWLFLVSQISGSMIWKIHRQTNHNQHYQQFWLTFGSNIPSLSNHNVLALSITHQNQSEVFQPKVLLSSCDSTVFLLIRCWSLKLRHFELKKICLSLKLTIRTELIFLIFEIKAKTISNRTQRIWF